MAACTPGDTRRDAAHCGGRPEGCLVRGERDQRVRSPWQDGGGDCEDAGWGGGCPQHGPGREQPDLGQAWTAVVLVSVCANKGSLVGQRAVGPHRHPGSSALPAGPRVPRCRPRAPSASGGAPAVGRTGAGVVPPWPERQQSPSPHTHPPTKSPGGAPAASPPGTRDLGPHRGPPTPPVLPIHVPSPSGTCPRATGLLTCPSLQSLWFCLHRASGSYCCCCAMTVSSFPEVCVTHTYARSHTCLVTHGHTRTVTHARSQAVMHTQSHTHGHTRSHTHTHTLQGGLCVCFLQDFL